MPETQKELILDTSVCICIDFLGYMDELAPLYNLFIPRQIKTELKGSRAQDKAGYSVPEHPGAVVSRGAASVFSFPTRN